MSADSYLSRCNSIHTDKGLDMTIWIKFTRAMGDHELLNCGATI